MFKSPTGITSSSQWPRGRHNHNHNHNYNYGKGKTWINFWQNPLCWLASLKHHIHKSWSSSWVGVVGEVTSSCWKPQQVSEEQRKGDSDIIIIIIIIISMIFNSVFIISIIGIKITSSSSTSTLPHIDDMLRLVGVWGPPRFDPQHRSFRQQEVWSFWGVQRTGRLYSGTSASKETKKGE